MKPPAWNPSMLSLDAMDEEIFFRMSKRRGGRSHHPGHRCRPEGRTGTSRSHRSDEGMNDSQSCPCWNFAFHRNLRIRYLEVMAMGTLYETADQYLFSQKDILSV